MPRNILASRILFSWRSILLPCQEIFTCANVALLITRYQQATGKQCMLGFEPLTRCCYSNNGGKMTFFLCIPHVPKIGTTICFPYLARQVSNSWHMQDGFFLHERKGSHMMFSSLLKAMLSSALFWGMIYSETKPTHFLSSWQMQRLSQKSSRFSNK